MIFIHIRWDRSQRSHSCLHSIEVDRACKHSHIHKNTHANEGTMPKLLTCAVPTGTIAACQRSLARGPILEKIGTCASLHAHRTRPSERITAKKQASFADDALSRARTFERSPYASFPLPVCHKVLSARPFLLPGTTRTQKITDLFCYFNRNAHGRGGPGGGCGPCVLAQFSRYNYACLM